MRRLRVPRTARYHVLGRPESAPEVWVVIHGYGQLAERFVGRFAALPGVGSRRAVVAPEALSRFYVESGTGEHGPGSRVGASWMTRAERADEIADYVEYLDRVAAVSLGGRRAGDDASLVVLGFSQGAETASRWAVLGAHRARELVLWGGGLAADLDMGRAALVLRDTRIVFVAGAGDAWAQRRSDESLDRLSGAGLTGRRLDYEGGHRVEGDVLARHWT